MNSEVRKFSSRLNIALDDAGFPKKGMGRQSSLVRMLGVSHRVAKKWLEGEEFPRTPKTGLDFVHDQQDTVILETVDVIASEFAGTVRCEISFALTLFEYQSEVVVIRIQRGAHVIDIRPAVFRGNGFVQVEASQAGPSVGGKDEMALSGNKGVTPNPRRRAGLRPRRRHPVSTSSGCRPETNSDGYDRRRGPEADLLSAEGSFSIH